MKRIERGIWHLRGTTGLVGMISLAATNGSALAQNVADDVGANDAVAKAAEDAVAVSQSFELIPSHILFTSIAVGCIVAGISGLVFGVRGRKVRSERETELAIEAEKAREAFDDAQALLVNEPHLLFLWRGAVDGTPVISGMFPPEFDLPDDLEGRLDFARWLEPSDATQLNVAVTELKIAGTPFNIFVQTPNGGRIAADGFVIAGKAALKLKPLHGDSLDFIEVRERIERLDLEIGSLKAALGSSPQPAWIRGAEGDLIWVNGAYAEVCGLKSAAEAIAGRVEFSSAAAAAQSLATTRTGEVSRQRLHINKNGPRRTFEVVEVPAPLGSAGIATEVTQIDELCDELDRHIAAHGRTLDRMTTAVAIFDPEERLKFFNSAYANLWGLDGAWLRQEPKDGEILDQLRDQGRLEERADYRTWRKSRLDAYHADETEVAEEEWHLPDGRTLRVVAEPHPFGGLTYLYEDVTEKLTLEARYNGLLSVQKETLDNLHEGVALFGPDGRLKLFNPAFAAIWKLDAQALGKEPHMDALISACTPLTGPTEHWDELRRSITAIGEGRKRTSGRIHRADGVVVDHAGVPLPDGATLFTYVDMSDGWRIEQALRERNELLLATDQLKTAFLSHVSYELRAPLTPIMGYAELLARGSAGELNEKQAEYVGVIYDASEDLRDLVDNIIDLTTIDAGSMELESEEIDIDELVHQVVRGSVEKQVQTAGLTLSFDVSADIAGFKGDGRRIRQVIMHLLSNAIGFSTEGGHLVVGARQGTSEVSIFVSDQGRGIDPAVQERVFERFETYTEGTTHRGSGLGLAIVKGLVELHHGRVEIETEAGKGTTVTCHFPRLPVSQPSDNKSQQVISGHKVSPALDQNAPPTASQH